MFNTPGGTANSRRKSAGACPRVRQYLFGSNHRLFNLLLQIIVYDLSFFLALEHELARTVKAPFGRLGKILAEQGFAQVVVGLRDLAHSDRVVQEIDALVDVRAAGQ